ncbi:hypothetical protein [Natronoarchaeum rubrum]|uniref:hypothetical protein n=1 Tax=Natronoarchaeum rubrum TaxID=755311 RepID=UPI0021114F9A|nr:hypothetical protein [Natronoarchaeum rubrum]
MREESERAVALNRRACLAGIAGLSATAGCQGLIEAPVEAGETSDADDESDFVWLSGSLLSNEAIRENLLAFAARRDLAAILAIPNPKASGAIESLHEGLATAKRLGVPAWLHAGVLTDVTADEFAGSRDARERNLTGIRRAVETYSEFESGGKLIPWQEAPVMGGWSDEKWDDEAVDNLRTYGPAVFAAQRRVAREVDPEIDVGVFVHFPYVVDSKQPDVFARLLDDLHRQGTPPDFAFADYYRGWYEKDVGPERANDAVRSLVSNAKAGLRGGDVYYMGQSHTINPGHTPSRQSLRMDHRAALDAGADGVGWYARTAYVPTEQGFDPLVPNPEGSAAADRAQASTFTVARDRYRYAWAATADARAATEDADAGATSARYRGADRFDLWLRCPDAGFYDHRVRLRTGDGGWRFVGDVGTYLDGAAPYADAGAETIRALDRERYLGDGHLDVEIETGPDADATPLVEAAAVPSEPGADLTDADVAAAMASGEHAAAALGRERVDDRLAPGETVRLSISVDADAEESVGALLGDDRASLRRRLADAEAAAETPIIPGDRFDLWVLGEELPDAGTVGTELRVGELSGPGKAALVSTGSPDAALFSGIDRQGLFGDGAAVRWSGADRPEWSDGVEAVVAMPYFGSGNVVTPARAAELVGGQPSEVRTYALAVASAP